MELTIREVIDNIIRKIPGEQNPDTVDTFKTGNPNQKISAIVTTFIATYGVIENAVKLGANLIITHEPTFYNHYDDTEWLDKDPVYRAKRTLLEENNIVIWRFHDHLHRLHPGGIITGMLKELGWEEYVFSDIPYLCNIPTLTLLDLGNYLKEKLNIDSIKLIGDLNMNCKKIGLAVGASGGEIQISRLSNLGLDVLICGEINEWETSEYVRDAISVGQNKALIVIGHAPSEEAGMKHLVGWLQSHFPDVKIDFLQTKNPFHWL
jgi:putative NIF3 family GTP cyclohydrolase 1 type 2